MNTTSREGTPAMIRIQSFAARLVLLAGAIAFLVVEAAPGVQLRYAKAAVLRARS